jgi:hypothetical protein
MYLRMLFLLNELNDTQNTGIASVNAIKGGNVSQQGTFVVKEDVKPIISPISLAEYQARKAALAVGLRDLENAQVLMTGTQIEQLYCLR